MFSVTDCYVKLLIYFVENNLDNVTMWQCDCDNVTNLNQWTLFVVLFCIFIRKKNMAFFTISILTTIHRWRLSHSCLVFCVCLVVVLRPWPAYYHYSNEMRGGVDEAVVSCYDYSILCGDWRYHWASWLSGRILASWPSGHGFKSCSGLPGFSLQKGEFN